MTSFGEKLQREREMRGITLEEIAEATKIGTRNLRALETNEFDKLPGGIFNKGFVRAYAKYLGIDEEQAVADYLTASGQADAPATGPLPELPPTVKLTTRRRRPWLVVVAVLVLAVAVFLVWRAFSQAHDASADEAAAPPASAAAAANKPAATPSPASDSAAAASTPAPASPSPQGSQAASADSASALQPAATPAPPGGAAASPTAAPAGFTLKVQAVRDCWVEVAVDGKSQGNHLMKASSQESIQANREIVMTVGNAGGLELYLNGRLLPPQGAEGQKRTLTFTAQGAR